jgi:uracil-DNA glycosylase family 4
VIGLEKDSDEAIRQDLIRIVGSLKEYLYTAQDVRRGIHNLTWVEGQRAAGSDAQGEKQNPPGDTRELESLRLKTQDCRRCPLWPSRRTIVFGEGNPDADLLFVGEGPGEEEDRQGRPFVGRAGQLLTNIIKAMGLQRENVYIANIVKCRPPGNRTPKPEEADACMPYLREQIRAIRPKVICALGAVAARYLLGTEAPVSALRGNFHPYEEMDVMVTYHPAYLLRNPAAKKQVWDDVQQIIPRLP